MTQASVCSVCLCFLPPRCPRCTFLRPSLVPGPQIQPLATSAAIFVKWTRDPQMFPTSGCGRALRSCQQAHLRSSPSSRRVRLLTAAVTARLPECSKIQLRLTARLEGRKQRPWIPENKLQDGSPLARCASLTCCALFSFFFFF